MTWRLAKSLAVLRMEANTVAPLRKKYADGTIGDQNHAGRASRHNPNSAGVVCALDLTHDPAGGMDTYDLFDWLRTHPHPDLEYVISNRRIASRTRGWTSRAYGGTSAHDKHIHIAVGRGLEKDAQPPYDDLDPWLLKLWAGQEPPPEEDEELTKDEREMLQYAAMWGLEAKIDSNIAKHLARGDTEGAEKIEETRKETITYWRERWGVV